MSSIISKILIPFTCKKVGQDEFGNKYFQNKDGKRFVIYHGMAEPSKIPPQWHTWIHYSSDLLPVGIDTKKLSWQKIHLPNLTGTKNAYQPSNTNPKEEFQSWNPNSINQLENHDQV